MTIKSSYLEALGENFEKTSKGFIDFLLLDTKGSPLIVLEAKSEDKNPLVGKEQYRQLFSPIDFDLVISDEAHRSIGGNASAVFDYFIGYKLGLTATPRDYLKRFEKTTRTTRDPCEAERRMLLDTYRTFGCENSQPTYRYSLLDGVKDGYLINPTVVDARTGITTELLSERGFVVSFTDDAGGE